MRNLLFGSVAAVSLLVGAPALAQIQPAAASPAIEAPRDVPYAAGPIQIIVDATDNDRRIFEVRETLPVDRSGPLTLHYPAWLPGNHAPRGPIEQMAGLTIMAAGKPVEWTRDPVDMYAFHLNVPPDGKPLAISFQVLSPT